MLPRVNGINYNSDVDIYLFIFYYFVFFNGVAADRRLSIANIREMFC